MKRTVLLLFFVLTLGIGARATTVTVASDTIPNINYPASPAITLRIYVTGGDFLTSDGVQILGGAVGSSLVYKTVTCSLNSTTHVLTVSSFTIDTTSNALVNAANASYTAILYSGNTPKDRRLTNFRVPLNLSPSTTWALLIGFNATPNQRPSPLNYATTTYVDNAILNLGPAAKATTTSEGTARVSVTPADAAHPIARGINDSTSPVGGPITDFGGQVFNVKAYGAACDGSTADTSAIAAANTAAAAVGGALYIPPSTSGCKIGTATLTAPIRSDGGSLFLTTGQTTTITSSLTIPPQTFFRNATAGLGTVSFSGNKTLRAAHPEWWGAKGDGLTGSATANAAALNATSTALLTINSGEILLGPGNYYFNALWTIGNDAGYTGISVGGTNGLVGTVLTWNGSTSGNAIFVNKGRSNHFHDLMLFNGVVKGSTVGVLEGGNLVGTNVSGTVFERVTFRGWYRGFVAGTSNAASEIYFNAVLFDGNTEGAFLTDLNTLDITFLNSSWTENSAYGIHAETGNVVVINGSAGANGCDFRSDNGLPFSVLGFRTESKRLFEGQATAAYAGASFINVTRSAVEDFTVTGATNATPIEITTTASHGFSTLDYVHVLNVGGNTAANGDWVITVTAANKFTLTSSVGNGNYTSGGLGFKDWGVIKAKGTSVAVDNSLLNGMIWISSTGSADVRGGAGLFPYPLRVDPEAGGGSNNPYSIDNWEQVDTDNVLVRTLNERGTVISGVLVPEKTERLLSTTSGVDMNTATATTLYTCPTVSGRTCVITRVVVREASTSLTTAAYSFGWTSAAFSDVIANATHTELTGSTLLTTLFPKVGQKVGTTGGTFKVLMNTLQGGAATTTIDVYGYFAS